MKKIVPIIADALSWLGFAVVMPVCVVCLIAMALARYIMLWLLPVYYDPEITPYGKEYNQMLDKGKALIIRLYDTFNA